MRKIKLQMQISIDGYVAGPNGELDWMTWNWDNKLEDYVDKLTDSIDTILLGRKMSEGFISHWSDVLTKPGDPSYPFAKIIIDTPKIVFSKTLKESAWENTTIASDPKSEIEKLKKQEGKDIIVYGGSSFVSSLIEENLIDEYYLFVNPVTIGNGMTIFKQKKEMSLLKAESFSCGIVLHRYKPQE